MTDRRFIRHQHINSQGARMLVQCRFCRLEEEYNKYHYVAPCGCMGPTRFVHKDCLQSWITVKFEDVYNQPYEGDPLDFNIFCQVCHQRMEIEFELTSKCCNYDQFLENLEEYKMWFLLVLLIAILSIAVLIFLLIYSSTASPGNGSFIAVSIAAVCFVLVADVVFFLWKFIVIRSIDIQKIPNNKDPPKLLGFQEPNIESIEKGDYEDPHFGGEPSRKDTFADKSLMLESRRQSRRDSNGTDRASSIASKTLTDLVMRQMYKHDMTDSRRESEVPKLTKVKDTGPVMRDQEAQVTLVEKENQKQVKNKSVQMSIQEKSLFPRNRTRSKKIFSFEEQEQSKPHESEEISEKQSSQRQPEEKKMESRREPRYQPSSKSSSSENQGFNIIKEKPSEDSGTPKAPSSSSKPAPKESKLKLRTSKDPIKIKVMF